MDRERYRALFLAEAKDHLAASFELHGRLEAGHGDDAVWKDLLRRAHSLKGMAATMGYGSLVELAHAMEDSLAARDVQQAGDSKPRLSLIADCLACMTRIVERVERDEPTDSETARSLARALAQAGGGAAHRATADSVPVATPPDRAHPLRDGPSNGCVGAASYDWRVDLLLEASPARSAEFTVEILGRLATLGRVVQVDPPRLDCQTGCFEGRLGMILRTDLQRDQLSEELRQLSGLQGCSLTEAAVAPVAPKKSEAQRWVRVRVEQLDLLVEGLHELRLRQARLRTSLPAACRVSHDHLERAEMRLEEIYGNVLELRLIPFGAVAQRLHQTVRELAVELGKEVHFEIVGEQVGLDRCLLDALMDPLLHMVRNAMDHGLETPERRRAAGKSERGELMLELERRGERVHVRLADDGRGMDPDEMRRKAVDSGLLEQEQAARMDRREALLLATRTGFTTAESVSHLSGRGIGLDVVRETVERLGGALTIQSEPGTGARVALEVPLRMALVQSLLVRSAGELYAVPIEAVQQTLSPGASENVRDPVRLSARGEENRSCGEAAGHDGWIVVLDTGGSVVNLAVDEVVGRREIVVKPLQPPLSKLRPYAGAVLLENGAIALVVDPPQLATGS